ncbi:GAF domain-containing protein [Oecophyllibacter saccharovorans]|uniref:GAF domain-containing protein n=1 Tax=Oecophyllibacter saccharovorans TaxID=2558360 RepID=A0A506UQ98_9PROT|nr:GAF domain-containing protein [Oecophyllibacter saccharovorans]TPW35479.1 GAF domain-containing protein [Oecophyllibacter saccharovorans]
MSAPPRRESWSLEDILEAARGLLAAETDVVANLANLSALLYEALPDVNWAGFYVVRDGMLVLGPFQGRIACTRIPLGRGVCGTAAQTGSVQRVADVHAFAGHIACDVASRSEIVVLIFRPGPGGKELFGVLDIDSPLADRFTHDDAVALQRLVDLLEASLSVQKQDGSAT